MDYIARAPLAADHIIRDMITEQVEKISTQEEQTL